ncbi:amidohydrolase family protein [Mycobacteroides abscessus]|uniref:amidohydrolase family protein n=1 Tax=Mycobacteroides abscessus TaxID=36809 RepID=UPI000927CF27|nr:amidohydrolase family protein [Mycobacteroides abscessus]SHS15645.1 amidohydrolase [Mycobacteroides abscessus subsp. bolletii]SKQ48190.1 amidohydrolase [Mycobacteroides abscessus subsp. massiliense]SLF33959.1 amidohydrolase [Mycobacteroides abscessus subsp. abscessus]SLF35614.1 amidohydrolase [Mycobacteroides abscessus subsp. abscessus]
MSNERRIDTHHHIVVPAYRDWVSKRGISAGGLAIPQWDVDTDLAFMDCQHIQTSILSVSTPGTHLGDDAEALKWARRVNDYAAEVTKSRPDRFGFFATLPLPYLDGALNEATRALDELNADGIVLYTNYHGIYLGAPVFEPLMVELGRRGTVVFIHPSELPAGGLPAVPAGIADFLLDSVRAATYLTLTDTPARYPKIKFILSHGGGFLPYAAHRIAQLAPVLADTPPRMDGDSILTRLRHFYFDTALAANRDTFPSLLAFADPRKLIFGSDFPYANAEVSSYFTTQLDEYPLPEGQRFAINRGNAEVLFPRLVANNGSGR